MTSRRGFLIGIGAALAAPAIVKAESLMKIAQLRGVYEPPLVLSERTITELFTRLEGQLGINPTRLVLGTAWQVIKADDGTFEIVEYSPEDVYAQAP